MYNNSNVNSFDFDSNVSGDNGISYNDIDINMMDNNMNTGMMGDNMIQQGGCCGPVSECPQERCVHRTIMHEVPQV
ncbi:MAG: hypothetical protein J6B89_01515 [Bacilli bacterium]|nr:hypothetical protein [Bacilli bacterium]